MLGDRWIVDTRYGVRLSQLAVLCMPLWLGGLSTQVQSASKPVITVIGDNWCPYNCDADVGPKGYLVDLLERAWGQRYRLKYELVPWTRAIQSVEKGEMDALVSTTPSTSRHLRISEPLGLDRTCFFVRTGDRWVFNAISSLNGRRLGLVRDYQYDEMGEIDQWIAKQSQNRSATLDFSVGDNATEQNIRKLVAGRIDTVVENQNVAQYLLKKLQLDGQVAGAGCALSKPGTIHIGLNARLQNVDGLLSELNSTVVRLRQTGELKNLLDRYGIQDWAAGQTTQKIAR